MSATHRTLTTEQQAFVREFLVDLNATGAAIRAGFRPDEAPAAGSRLLRMSEVTKAVADALVRRSDRTIGLGRMLKHVMTGAIPLRRAARFILELTAARAGFAVTRLPPVGGSSADSGPADLLHAYHKGKCFYCRGDSPIAQRILRGGEWDPHLKRVLHKVCARRAGGTIVEVGANIGGTFLPECAALPDFKFVLIEPLPIFFEILKQNVASLEARNVVLHNLAVSDGHASDVVIIHDDVSGGIAAAGSFLRRQRVAIVQSDSLDRMFPEEAVILLKADVDGYELDVFRGGRELITRTRPDIVFEFNPLAIEVRGFSPLDLPSFLASAGLDTFDLYTDDGRFIETTTVPERVYGAFRALRKPLSYLDVHAYAS